MNRICRKHGTYCADRIKIGLQPGASGSYKRWPLRNFAGLALKLLKYSGQASIFILGSTKENRTGKRLEDAIIQAGGASERVINMTGKVDIGELAKFIKGLDLVVTNDTGPLHIAIATGTPTISLFVPTNVHGTGPVQDLHIHKVIKKEKPCRDCVEKYCEKPDCMSLITVDDVFRAVISSPPFKQQ
jgi:ADP-heptose:LPS heptosyltransferase